MDVSSFARDPLHPNSLQLRERCYFRRKSCLADTRFTVQEEDASCAASSIVDEA
jgi:hypothetical protein